MQADAQLQIWGKQESHRSLSEPLNNFPFDLQARLIDASSVQDVYEIGVAIIARIPATISIRIFQRDDQSRLLLVHAWQSPLTTSPKVSSDQLGHAVHQRWIAAHGVGQNPAEFANPFIYEEHPAWLVVPILAGDELIGAIAAERRDGDSFPYAPEDIVAFASAAAGMSWGIQSIFLRDRSDVNLNQEALAEIAARERREVGRELHDNVVQNMAYLNMKMEIIAHYVENNPGTALKELNEARELLDNSITELRRTIGEMRRPAPSRRGITGQLRALATNIEIDRSELEMDLHQISGVQLVPEVERAVVGIVREALQNVRKHASANSVRLEVSQTDDELYLEISDDGQGMEDPAAPGPEGHFGLVQMRELAEDLGGELIIASDNDSGTRIEARLPLVVPATPAGVQSGSGLSASEYLSQPPSGSSAGFQVAPSDSHNTG